MQRALAVTALLVLAACGEGTAEHGVPFVAREQQAPIEPSYAQRVPAVPAGASEQEAVESLLDSYCGECHASGLEQLSIEGDGMYYIDNEPS